MTRNNDARETKFDPESKSHQKILNLILQYSSGLGYITIPQLRQFLSVEEPSGLSISDLTPALREKSVFVFNPPKNFLLDLDNQEVIETIRAARLNKFITFDEIISLQSDSLFNIEQAESLNKFFGSLGIAVIDFANFADHLSSERSDIADGPRKQPPIVPIQTNSAHFTITDGYIATIPTQEFGDDENDYRKLGSLQTPLLHAIDNAQAELSKGNQPFGFILDALGKYRDALDLDTESINYAVLYAYGLSLGAALSEANRMVAEGDLPDFNLASISHVRTVVQLHGPFILSSKDGRELVADAERYARNPMEERIFQRDMKEFGNILSNRKDIVEEHTTEFIRDITTTDNNDFQIEREQVFKKGAAKNLVIVLSAGALVASTSLIPSIGPFVAIPLGLITLEALKKSKAFGDLSDPLRRGFDELRDYDFEKLSNIPRDQLEKIRQFVVQNSDLLRKVGGSAQEMEWFRQVLDWIGRDATTSTPVNRDLLVQPLLSNKTKDHFLPLTSPPQVLDAYRKTLELKSDISTERWKKEIGKGQLLTNIRRLGLLAVEQQMVKLPKKDVSNPEATFRNAVAKADTIILARGMLIADPNVSPINVCDEITRNFGKEYRTESTKVREGNQLLRWARWMDPYLIDPEGGIKSDLLREAATNRNKSKSGRATLATPERIAYVKKRMAEGASRAKAMREMGLSGQTGYIWSKAGWLD